MGTVRRYAKAVVTAIGGAATVIVATVPPDNDVTRWAAVVLLVLTIFGVTATPNERTLDEAKNDLRHAAAQAGVPKVTVLAAGRPLLGRPAPASGHVRRLDEDPPSPEGP